MLVMIIVLLFCRQSSMPDCSRRRVFSPRRGNMVVLIVSL